MYRSGRDAGSVCDTGKKSVWKRGEQRADKEGSPTPHVPSDQPCSPLLHQAVHLQPARSRAAGLRAHVAVLKHRSCFGDA